MIKPACIALTLLALSLGSTSVFAKEKEKMMKSEEKMTKSEEKMTKSEEKMTKSENPMVGGAPMYVTKDIVDNAVNSKDHTTLVTAVKAAGLVDTLKSKGPFTVFAPTNEAFNKLPKGTVETLVKPESKKTLSGILTYHVVPGDYTSDKLAKAIKAGGGSAKLKTANGAKLTVKMEGDSVVVVDTKGGKSTVTIADVKQSNGVIHVVDTVLMP
jgi:uncharacterized surface protein with fasciclin (FAS1) repeats